MLEMLIHNENYTIKHHNAQLKSKVISAVCFKTSPLPVNY